MAILNEYVPGKHKDEKAFNRLKVLICTDRKISYVNPLAVNVVIVNVFTAGSNSLNSLKLKSSSFVNVQLPDPHSFHSHSEGQPLDNHCPLGRRMPEIQLVYDAFKIQENLRFNNKVFTLCPSTTLLPFESNISKCEKVSIE